MKKALFTGAAFLLLFFFFAPHSLAADSSSLNQLSCIFPVKMAGTSMEPRFKDGERVSFNKCLDEVRDKLAPGTPVLFQRQGSRSVSISVIRDRLVRPEGVFYRVSRETTPDATEEISATQLVGYYQAGGGLNEEEQKALSNFRGNPLIALGGFITTAIFWLSIIFWKKKTGVAWRFFTGAVLVWGFMFGLKAVMDFKINFSQLLPGLSAASLGGAVFFFLYYGLRTGLTENGFSYIYIKKKLKEASFNEAVAFGIAFNGVEALMIGLWTLLVGLALFVKPELLNLFPLQLRQQVIQAFGGTALSIPAQWVERFSVLLIGIFASLLVFMTARVGKWKYFWLAVVYKMIIDGGFAVFLMRYPEPAGSTLAYSYLVQIPIVISAIIGVFGILWLKKIYPRGNASPAS